MLTPFMIAALVGLAGFLSFGTGYALCLWQSDNGKRTKPIDPIVALLDTLSLLTEFDTEYVPNKPNDSCAATWLKFLNEKIKLVVYHHRGEAYILVDGAFIPRAYAEGNEKITQFVQRKLAERAQEHITAALTAPWSLAAFSEVPVAKAVPTERVALVSECIVLVDGCPTIVDRDGNRR